MNQTESRMNVRIVLYAMAIIFSAGMLFLGYTLTETPHILSFLYDRITLPAGIQFIGHFKWLFNLFIICLSALPAAAVLYLSELGFSRYVSKNMKK